MSEYRKNAIVTGAAGGIGYATVKRLIGAGFTVTAMDVRPYEGEVMAMFENFGEDATYVAGNLAEEFSRQQLVDTALRVYGSIDVLCNVAGVAPKVRRDILEMTEESYDFVMDINTRGTLFLTQAVANRMLEQEPDENAVRGYIVNISSCSAYTSSPSRAEYCISKAGVSMMTKLFADRLAGEGILVNEICPGIIATGMTAVVKEKYDRLIEDGLVPEGRWGYPDDIAKAVLSLCDGTLAYTTGQSLIVDGGMHIRRL